MAEFKEVVAQIKRMCESHGAGCHDCPAKAKSGLCALAHDDEFIPEDWEEIKAAEIEMVVMRWAANNPGPRYPRWVDVLYEMGVFRDEVHHGNVHTCRLTDKAYAPIPADIAEKLGIKPIGGEK